MATAADDQLAWLEKLLKTAYECKASYIGPGGDTPRQGRILGRIITYCDWGIQYEADPVHAEALGADAELRHRRPTPAVVVLVVFCVGERGQRDVRVEHLPRHPAAAQPLPPARADAVGG